LSTRLTRIAHLSDLHFGRVDQDVVDALASELAAASLDLVVVSGDLTMAARIREFEAARAFLDRLGAPVLAVPGNHDVSPYRLVERFVDPWRAWRAHICRDTEPFWSNGDVTVVGLNSARAVGLGFDWSDGRLSRRQLQRAAERFASGPRSSFRVIVTHHPLTVPPTLIDYDVVGRARMALRQMAELHVRLVLTGHLHVGALHQLPASNMPAPRGTPLFVLGASATSTRLRGEPNGYQLISIAADGFALARRVWTGKGFATLS
jgi:3',5'-cyclic AMP phosphodiesterase CpdA